MNRPIGVGVAGLKHGMASVREVLLQEDYRLVALCSRTSEAYDYLTGKPLPRSLESVTFTAPRDQLIRECRELTEFSGVDFTTDYARFLEHPEMEAVIVAVPIPLNAPFAQQALERGKHVLASKPFGLTLQQGMALQRAVEQAHTAFMVNYEFRYSPLMQSIRTLVEGGGIGRLQLMWWNMFRMPFRGVYARRESSGGPLVAEVCHWFDLFGLFNGETPFKRVAAFGGTDILGDRQEIEDNGVCIIEYENGVRGSINFTYFTDQPRHNIFGLVGDSGKIEADTEEAGRYTLFSGPQQNRTEFAVGAGAHRGHLGFDEAHRRFARLVRDAQVSAQHERTVERNHSEAQRGFESLLISLATQRAMDTGRVITRREMLEETAQG